METNLNKLMSAVKATATGDINQDAKTLLHHLAKQDDTFSLGGNVPDADYFSLSWKTGGTNYQNGGNSTYMLLKNKAFTRNNWLRTFGGAKYQVIPLGIQHLYYIGADMMVHEVQHVSWANKSPVGHEFTIDGLAYWYMVYEEDQWMLVSQGCYHADPDQADYDAEAVDNFYWGGVNTSSTANNSRGWLCYAKYGTTDDSNYFPYGVASGTMGFTLLYVINTNSSASSVNFTITSDLTADDVVSGSYYTFNCTSASGTTIRPTKMKNGAISQSGGYWLHDVWIRRNSSNLQYEAISRECFNVLKIT